MFRQALFIGLLLLSSGSEIAAQQTPDAKADSVEYYLDLLSGLADNNNYQPAKIVAADFRQFLSANRLACPPAAVRLLSDVYRSGNDLNGAIQFFDWAERNAYQEKDPAKKALLLEALVAAFMDWNTPIRALANQKVLLETRDTLHLRQLQHLQAGWQQQIDSLQQVRWRENHAQSGSLVLDRNTAILGVLLLLLILAALVAANYRSAALYRKRLLHKDIEMDLLRGSLQPDAIAQPFVAETAQPSEPALPRERTYYAQGEGPELTALVIEPNRQIIFYLKSLLADRFQIETAYSASEGLHAAQSTLPDLIVCDAILNGQSGIEIVRQLKLSEKTGHIPVILLSAHHGKDGRLDALRAGADVWFTRPVADEAVGKSINQLLDARKDRHAEFSRVLQLYFTENRSVPNDKFLQATLKSIEQRMGDPDFLADELARKLQLSNHHFSKKMRAMTGKDPAQLIREMRLEKAKVLLEKGVGLPQAVSEMVGFSNSGAFTVAFKEYFGEHTLLLSSAPTR